jgi:hypothetical protein
VTWTNPEEVVFEEVVFEMVKFEYGVLYVTVLLEGGDVVAV